MEQMTTVIIYNFWTSNFILVEFLTEHKDFMLHLPHICSLKTRKFVIPLAKYKSSFIIQIYTPSSYRLQFWSSWIVFFRYCLCTDVIHYECLERYEI